MKFDLEVRNIQGAKRIILPFLCTYPRSFGRVEGVLDTGAPQTILSARDALRLNIPFKNFQSTRPIKGFGKGGTPALQISDFKISLRSTEGKSKNLKFPIVVANVPSIKKSGEDNLNSSLMLPTLIGLDFLESNGFKLVADLPNNSAYLETLE